MPTKTLMIRVRVDTRTKAKWEKAAGLRARPLSEFIREACDNYADKVTHQVHLDVAREKLEERAVRRAVVGKGSFEPDWK